MYVHTLIHTYVRTYLFHHLVLFFLFHHSLDEESVKRIIFQTLKAVNYIHLNNVSELAVINQGRFTSGEESLVTTYISQHTSHPVTLCVHVGIGYILHTNIRI